MINQLTLFSERERKQQLPARFSIGQTVISRVTRDLIPRFGANQNTLMAGTLLQVVEVVESMFGCPVHYRCIDPKAPFRGGASSSAGQLGGWWFHETDQNIPNAKTSDWLVPADKNQEAKRD